MIDLLILISSNTRRSSREMLSDLGKIKNRMEGRTHGKIKPKTLGKVTPLTLTPELYERLASGGLTGGQGGYQGTCERIRANVRTVSGQRIANVTARELDQLREWAKRDDAGGWQDWARAVLAHNEL